MTDQEREDILKREFDSMRGKVCSVIEAMGMPHSQERAAIALVKQYTYDTQQKVSGELGDG